MAWSTPNKTIESVGVLGCGIMGKHIVRGLLEKGYTVNAFDVFAPARAAVAQMGAAVSGSPADAAKKSDVVITVLPGPTFVDEVLFGENGMISELTPEKVVVDCSTVDPKSTRERSRRVAEESGAAYLDCPILGRASAAGKWLLPTGGDESALDYVRPALLCFASQAPHIGGSGAGNALKLLNQMMFSCINAVTSEVMAIAPQVGLDAKVFYDTVAASNAATNCGLFREVGQSILCDGYDQPNFTVETLIKDASLGMQMARDAGAPGAIVSSVQIYNELAKAQGYGKEDTSALYKVFSHHYEKG